ncbi:MAG: histidinol-phosphate transaminase [Candidatus Omnitrophica bacterium]|nr:histidinol-phosphate transaminase [Candidatus Omnitrophota bacterium]
MTTTMLKPIFKEFIEKIRPYEPGKPIKEVERELGLRRVVKLASNENPLGPSRKAVRAMRHALREAHLYPESTCFYLVKRISEELGVAENQILVGNGSNEIIEILMRGFVSEGDQVISSETSFLVYPILTQVMGAEYIAVPMKDFRYDLEGIFAAITEKTKMIFIANPNNPTGTYVKAREVEDFIAKVPKHILICFDEAYVDFVDAADFPHMLFHAKTEKPNIVLLRTFSKSYGLAGLRVGYAVAAGEIIRYLHKVRQPFNVNSLAQAGAAAALEDRFFLWRTRLLVRSGRKYLYKRLAKLGLRAIPSQANFILVDTGYAADEVFEALLRKGLIVRSMKAYGLSTFIRVTIGRRGENALFYRLLKQFLKEKQK